MKLLTPDPFLLLWTIFSFIHLALAVVAIIKILNADMSNGVKTACLLAVIFVPFAGVAFVFWFRAQKGGAGKAGN